MADPLDFDVTGARNAGFSDAAIADYLATKAGYDVAGARKAGFADADIIGHLVPPPKTAEAEPEPGPPPKKATIGDDLQRGLEQTRSSMQMLGADVAARHLNVIDEAKAKADRGEFLQPYQRWAVNNYEKAKINADRNLSESVVASIQHRKAADDLPISPEYKAFREAGSKGAMDVVKAFWRAPAEVLTSMLAEGAIASTPALAAGFVGGPAAGALVAGGQGYVEGYASKVAELLAQRRINLNDPAAVKAALADPKIAEGIRSEAALSAIPQAAANALSMAVGAKTMAPASLAGRPVAQQAVNIPAQAAVQGALAAAGEAGSQAIIGEDLQGGRVAAAGIQGAGQGPVDVAVFAARKAWVHGGDAVRDVGRKVMDAGNVDDAINMARKVVNRGELDAPAIEARKSGSRADQDEASLREVFGSVDGATVERAEDGSYYYRNPEGQVGRLQVWDGPQREDTIPASLVEAQRALNEKRGIRIVYYEGDVALPDGVFDPRQPDTIFLSNDPSRNAAQVFAHEVGHALEKIKLRDGTDLGDVLYRQVAEGMTETGWADAENLFGKTAPRRESFPEGPEGDRLHAAKRTRHLVREMMAETASEAPKLESYLPRVIDAVEARYGWEAARGVVRELIAGIRQTMGTLREFFFRPEEAGQYGPASTVLQARFRNLEAILDTLAKIDAERFTTQAEKENAALVAMRDRAAQEPRSAGEATETRAATPEAPGEARLTPEAQRPAVDQIRARIDTLQRWIGELDQQRRDAAAASPQARFLQQNIDAILKKVNGVEDRLTKKAAGGLAKARDQLDELLNPTVDSPDMARVRRALQLEQQRLADAAAARPREVEQPPARPAEVTSEAVREPAPVAEAIPETIPGKPEATAALPETMGRPAETPLAKPSPATAEVLPFQPRPAEAPSAPVEPLAIAAESPRVEGPPNAEGLSARRSAPVYKTGERQAGEAPGAPKAEGLAGDDLTGPQFSPRIKDRDLERARKTVDGVVEEVRRGVIGGASESFGTVTPWLEKVAKSHGLDVTGYRHAIDVSAVRHVVRRRTNEKIERSRGQVPVTGADFRLIPDVLAAPEFLVFGERSGRGLDTIGYIRRLDDGSLLYFEERRSGRQELAALSLRKYAAGTRAADIADNLDLYARNDGGKLAIVPVRDRSSALQLPAPGDRPSFSPRQGLTLTEAEQNLRRERGGGDAMTERQVFGPRSIKAIEVVDGRQQTQFSPRAAVDFEALAPTGTSIQGLRHLGAGAYNKLRSTEVHNDPTGQVIKFDGTGSRKTIMDAGEDLLRLVPALPELLRVAMPIGKPEPDARGRPDILAFHKLRATVETDGRTFGVILTVREMRDGTFHYALHKDDGREPGALPGSEDKGEPRSSPLDGAARSAGNIASARPPGKGEGLDGLIIVPHDLPSKPMFSPRSAGDNRTHDDTAELRHAYGNAGVPTPKAQRSVVDEARARIEARQRRYDQLDRPRRTDAEAVRPAEATPILERTVRAEGQPLFSPRQDRDTFAAEIMLDLAAVGEMFRYPRTKASAPEVALHDISPGIQFKGDATRPDEQQESGADRRLMFRTQRGHDFYLYENDGTFWIDVSRLDEGENGSAIYAALMDWAANTDRKFIGDPVHLSNIALRRRTDAMLSSALKHRSTDHMEPHPRQLAGDESLGVPPLVWSHGDTLGNIQNLIDVSSASFLAKVPELKNARFDFDTRTFRTGEGERLSDETFQKWANSLGRDRAAGAGSATLKRAIFLNSLLRAEGGSRPKLQAIALRGWGEPVRAADRILYSPRVTGNPDRRLAANLQGAEGLPVQRLPSHNNIGERRAGAALVVDTEKDVSNRGDDSFDIVPHDLPPKLVLSPRLNEQDLERARETIDNVVEARRRGEVGTPARSFGGVTPWLANLARKHGLEVAGYQHAIDVSAVRLIQNRHTNAAIEFSRGQAPVRPQDLRLIPDILAAPDFLAFGDRTRRGFDTIGYGKKFSDGSLLYFEQRLSRKRKLAAVSLWRYPAGTHADQIKYSLTHHARSDGGAATKVVAVDDQSSALQLPGPDDRPSFSPRFTEADLVKAAPAHSIGNEERPSGQRSAPIDSTRKPQFSPRQYGIPADAITITTFKSDEGIKAHRDYKEAKAGDPAAAARLVSGLVRPEQVETALAKFGPDTLYVPVVAEEATGHNAIPEFLARYYAEVTGADVARGIRQTVRAFHTGADAMGRLIARPEFEGPVEHGRSYVIVDDVSVLGGTLAELANHIQAGGGRIAGVVTLVNASRSGQYAPRRGHVALIERRFGNEIREAFGVEPGALTADEVQYLVNFKDADALRARRANAESERERRLREKGVLPSETQAEVRARGVEPDDKPQFSPRQDRRAPGFYSALTRAVENLKVEEMSPDQWRRTIQNLQGVKAAELKWVGLDDWLVERANRPSNGKPSSEKPITKQEILDFLQAHEIQVLEIEKRGGSSTWNIGRFRLSGGKGYRELLLLMPERADDKPYKSDHWAEHNVLAHVRFDQRTGSHGERILHLAEVQSDWHQEGRHQGYRWRTIGEIDRERAAVEAEFLRREPGLDRNNSSEVQSALSRSPDLWSRLLELQKERRKLPHSPFEKAWPELTMKRVIGYAAEHGYDRVTWETGATIVKRYKSRRKLGEIHHWSDSDGGIHTVAFDRRGFIILEPRVVEPPDRLTKLSRVFGRDLADRISREEGVASEKYEGASVIPGDGRLIGGEDMFAFYDDMLPNVVRKLGRRFGAEVADSWVENRNGRRIPVHGIDITPEMRRSVIEEGQAYLSPRQVADRPSHRAERNSFAAGRPLERGANRGIRIVAGGPDPSDEPERDLADEQRRVRAMYLNALKRRAEQSLSVME